MSEPKYSILLPTYNERENLPIMLWLINDVMTKSDFAYEVIVIGQFSDFLKRFPIFKDFDKIFR